MTANEHAASDTNVAAQNLLDNLAKLRRTKISCLDEASNGTLEVVHPESKAKEVPTVPAPVQSFRSKIAWKMAVKVFLGHVMAALALRPFIYEVSWACVIYLGVLVVLVNGLGAVMAAHRYYSHRSFKANLPLRIIMIISQTMCTQGSAFFWTRQHRLHHKYSDTDADPHNASRGFFFSHIGWLFLARHPLVTEKYKEINTSDLEADPIVMFQKRYYWEMLFIFGWLLPTVVPVYFFGDTWWNSYLVCVWLRIVLVNHATFSINSWAHLYGTRPYDKNIQPVETVWVSILSSGDGWHNYHHTFPWDYRASEYGAPFNLAARLIDMFAYIGWATDLKVVTPEMIATRVARTGDGTSTSSSSTSSLKLSSSN